MKAKLISYIITLAVFSACQSDLEKGLKNGTHKAFIECYDTKTKEEKDIAAEVEVKNGVVKKITPPSGKPIGKFDFWSTIDHDSQEVYGAGDIIYTVHIILNDY